MTIGAKPHIVIVDGQIAVNNSIPLQVSVFLFISLSWASFQSHPSHLDVPPPVRDNGPLNVCGSSEPLQIACYYITGPKLDYLWINGRFK